MRISKTVSNASAQHALGQWSSTPGPRTGTGPWIYKLYAGGDTTLFVGMWLVDSSHGNTVARVLPGRDKIVKR